MITTLACINKTCEHRWYCKNYEYITDTYIKNYIDSSIFCISDNYSLLDIDDDLKKLYEVGKRFRELFDITQEDINKALEEMRKE